MKFAQAAVSQYRVLGKEGRTAFFDLLAEEFAPDPAGVVAAAQRYAETRSPDSLVDLIRAAEPPRQELLRRLNRAPDGTATLLEMRRELLQEMKSKPRLAAVEADLHHLLSSWFNPGFLRLERVDWRAPALLLEKIIRYEAVHEIGSWTALRRRLEPDRRCFAFFHPALPDDPLIFVEVALVHRMPAAIGPLLDDERVDPEARRGDVRGVLLDLELPAGAARRLARQLPDQARVRSAQGGVPAAARRSARCRRFPGLRSGCSGARSSRPSGSRRAGRAARAGARARIDRCSPRAARTSAPRLAGAAAAEREALLRLGAAYLHGTLEADARKRPGREVPPAQRRPARAAQLPRQPVATGLARVVRADGQLPVRPAPYRAQPRELRARPRRRGARGDRLL